VRHRTSYDFSQALRPGVSRLPVWRRYPGGPELRAYNPTVTRAVASAFFRRALERAATLVSGNGRLGRLVAAANAALQGRGGALGAVRRDAQALVRLAREVVTGRYRALPKRSLVAIVAALLYFLDPLDLVPDFIPLVGFADDAAVLLWVASRVRKDLDTFLRWEVGQGPVIDVKAVTTPTD
jgi:uncharacterized membrane protein YkvA (DUF1232 family)